MELKTIRDFLYKDAHNDYAINYEELKSVNWNFNYLLKIKKQHSQEELIKGLSKNLSPKDRDLCEVLINKLVKTIFDDILECHKKIYD